MTTRQVHSLCKLKQCQRTLIKIAFQLILKNLKEAMKALRLNPHFWKALNYQIKCNSILTTIENNIQRVLFKVKIHLSNKFMIKTIHQNGKNPKSIPITTVSCLSSHIRLFKNNATYLNTMNDHKKLMKKSNLTSNQMKLKIITGNRALSLWPENKGCSLISFRRLELIKSTGKSSFRKRLGFTISFF